MRYSEHTYSSSHIAMRAPYICIVPVINKQSALEFCDQPQTGLQRYSMGPTSVTAMSFREIKVHVNKILSMRHGAWCVVDFSN